MSEPFLGEIKIISWNYAPNGWALCNGQLLPINQNQALFSILGTTYGGNGQTNFALPDFRGRAPVHRGNGFTEGQAGGSEAVTLNVSQLPAHNHVVKGSDSASPLQITPAGNTWAISTQNSYEVSSNAAMDPGTITSVGGSQPHTNMQPYLVLNFMIALIGIFPSQN